MAPLLLEGDTLGQKHHHYNKLVKAAVAEETAELLPLDYDDPDVDNLLRIDVACSRRNVEYVLKVLQCEDMMYVHRAIKQSTWLITDDQYAHIINPEYLNKELFPKITAKAKNKLLLTIRINLKNESRVDEFFKYYSDDMKVAQKWLPNCSLATIEKVYKDHSQEITVNTFKRLCEKSINVLKILLEGRSWYYIGKNLDVSKILLSKYAEEYLDILMNHSNRRDMPKFGIRSTQQIMKQCPDKVLNNFEKFANNIHLPTFVSCLKKDEIEDFLVKQAGNEKLKRWIKYDNIKHFVKYLPIATRFQFVKKLFIDKDTPRPKPERECVKMYQAMSACVPCGDFNSFSAAGPSTNASIYRWYRFASFDVAFADLKKLIRVESSPAERNAILTVLINCARRNPAHVKTLLQFYREKHINESFKFKIQFVNTFVSLVETHKFDESTWGFLNDIFSSMEVYTESENSVPYCVKAIIVYKLIHNEKVPDIIENKYVFDTFTEYKKKLEEKDREKVFAYLYNKEINKLNKQTFNNEVEMTLATDLLTNVLTLIKEWEKKITDYPTILEKIKQFIKTKKEKSWTTDLSYIYNVEKKWRRALFEESLILVRNDAACVHALKHDPGLLQRYSTEVAAMCGNDSISLKDTLARLRVYWSTSLARKWADIYLAGLEKQTGHRATVEGICILLPRKCFLKLQTKYIPVETKIDWSKTDATLLSLQKNIAKYMKLVRPSLDLEAVLSYAKDDYLQYALPSLNSLTHNMSPVQILKYIPVLFESPVSLKKHGLRLAYTKLKFSEIKDLVENMWKNTKNSSIKTVLFKETNKLLKKSKKDSAIKDLWQLLSMFIDNLTPEENRIIYDTLSMIDDVPLVVRPQYFVKSYTYLSSLPAKANCESNIKRLESHVPEIIDQLEPSFVEDVLLKPIPELVSLITGKTNDKDLHTTLSILTSYIMKSENEGTQYAKYEKYFVPILNGCLESWKTKKDQQFVVRNNCVYLLKGLLDTIRKDVVRKSELYTKMYNDIESRLQALPLEENYYVRTYCVIVSRFVKASNDYIKKHPESRVKTSGDSDQTDEEKENDKEWQEVCNGVAPLFGKYCLDFMKQDISSQLPTLSKYVLRAITDIFDQIHFHFGSRILNLKHMLDHEVVTSYLVVLKGIIQWSYYNKDEKVVNLKREILDIISKHPDKAVQICLYESMYSYPHQFEEALPEVVMNRC